MSEYRALCGRRGTCIVCGQPANDTHMNQAHAAPVIAKATKDFKDGLGRGLDDAYAYKVLSEQVLANIAKVSPPFVLGYREEAERQAFEERGNVARMEAEDHQYDQDWD